MTDEIFRAKWHDYRSPAMYFITINKPDDCPSYGKLIFSPVPYIEYSPVGHLISAGINELKGSHEWLKIYRHVIMPNHIHMVMHIREHIDEHLGNIIGRFKYTLTQQFHEKSFAEKDISLFRSGYNDKILTNKRSLDDVIQYTSKNPERLARIKLHPEWFRNKSRMIINGQECQLYGNLNLLENPFMSSVHISSKFSEKEREDYIDRKLYETACGGIAVGAFISDIEKRLRDAIAQRGGRFILLSADPIPEKFKPSRYLFNLCSEGRLLIISPMEAQRLRGEKMISKVSCRFMNEMAEEMEIQGIRR